MKKIEWTKLSAIAEILSSIAILTTLVYLAIQTEQNTQATRASSSQSVVENETNVIRELFDHPDLWTTMTKEELTDDEAVRLHAYLVTYVRFHENYWGLYQIDAIDEITLRQYERALVIIFSKPRVRNWWNNVKPQFNSEFVGRVDALLAASAVSPTPVADAIKQFFEPPP